MKTCVVIPTYNEAEAIGEVVAGIRGHGLEAVVIDDGSEDKTAEFARARGATVLTNVKNQGKGASLAKGFAFALQNGFDAVITMDGDGQHLPEELPEFLARARQSESGVLIGNRMHRTQAMPRLRIATNKLMSLVISRIARQHIPDTQCGFRLFKREVLEKIRLRTTKFETDSELLIKAARLGFRIESVPIKTVYDGQKSQINPLIDTVRFIKFLFKELWTTR